MFGSKKNHTDASADLDRQLLQQKLAPYEFHSMPEKFRSVPPLRQGHRVLAVLAVIAVIVIAAGAAAAYLYLSQTAAPSAPSPAPIDTIVPPQQAPEVQAPVVSVGTPEAAAPSPETPSAPAVPAAPAAPATPEPSLPVAAEPVSAVDTDKDGLTDNEEEQLYRSQRLVPDTDGDGFLDGAEVTGGYSPIAANATLLDSGLANTYEHPSLGYRVVYPAAWIARPGDDLSTVVFQSSTREQVTVRAQELPSGQGFIDWYIAQHPGSDPNALESITTRSGLRGIRVRGERAYYVYDDARPGRVYILTHALNGVTTVSFDATFQLMVQTFRLGA